MKVCNCGQIPAFHTRDAGNRRPGLQPIASYCTELHRSVLFEEPSNNSIQKLGLIFATNFYLTGWRICISWNVSCRTCYSEICVFDFQNMQDLCLPNPCQRMFHNNNIPGNYGIKNPQKITIWGTTLIL